MILKAEFAYAFRGREVKLLKDLRSFIRSYIDQLSHARIFTLCLSGFISVFIYGVSALRWMASEPRYAFQLDDMNYWTVPRALSYLRSGFTRYWWLYFGASGLFRLFICRVTPVQRSPENVFIVFFPSPPNWTRYNYFSNIGSRHRASERKKGGTYRCDGRLRLR